MEQKIKNVLSYVICMIISFAGGLGGSFLLPGPGVKITTLKDNQIVHSKIPIDISTRDYDYLEVYVDDKVVGSYVPHIWNNMQYPVGNYTLRVVTYKNEAVKDNVSIVVEIPETFIVPENYTFSEDFVVHEGQTVYMNYDFNIADGNISNGWTSIDELQYYDINVYGTLYINGNITCTDFLGEGNSTIYWNDGYITTLNEHAINFGAYSKSSKFIRFDDNSKLYINDDYPLDIDGNIVKKLDGRSSDIVFLENS
jgi:hypothetical protein